MKKGIIGSVLKIILVIVLCSAIVVGVSFAFENNPIKKWVSKTFGLNSVQASTSNIEGGSEFVAETYGFCQTCKSNTQRSLFATSEPQKAVCINSNCTDFNVDKNYNECLGDNNTCTSCNTSSLDVNGECKNNDHQNLPSTPISEPPAETHTGVFVDFDGGKIGDKTSQMVTLDDNDRFNFDRISEPTDYNSSFRYEPVRDGWFFARWYNVDTNETIDSYTVFDKNTSYTIKAEWSDTPIVFFTTFEINGYKEFSFIDSRDAHNISVKSYKAPDGNFYIKTESIPKIAFDTDIYYCNYIYTRNSNGTGSTPNDPNSQITFYLSSSDTELKVYSRTTAFTYGVYKKHMLVTINTNGGSYLFQRDETKLSGTEPRTFSINILKGEDVNFLSNFTELKRNGYAFNGWYKKSGSEKQYITNNCPTQYGWHTDDTNEIFADWKKTPFLEKVDTGFKKYTTIIASSVGSFVGILVIVLLIVLCCRKKKKKSH